MENEIIINWVTYVKKDNQKKQSKRGEAVWWINKKWEVLWSELYVFQWENIDIIRAFCYPTEAEAIKVRDKQLALYRIKTYAEDKRGEFVPDWNNNQQRKYFISCDHEDNQYWVMDYTILQFINIFYLEKKEHCNEIIEKFKDDLDILFDRKWNQ